jgi:acetyl esterase/lipase
MPSFRGRLYRLLMGVGSKRAFDWERDVAARRAFLDRVARLFRPPRGTRVSLLDMGGVRTEEITAPGARTDAALLYLHGGAFVLGWNGMYRRMVATLSQMSGVRALAPDYRLAPEHPFPAALEDCLAAYRWLLRQGTPPERIVLAGDSAGGNLALATLLALRDHGEPLPAAAVCLSPVTDLESTGESYFTRAAADPMIHPDGTAKMRAQYAPNHDPHDPLLSPLNGELRGLPPLLLLVGGDEVLLSDSTRLAKRAKAVGVEARLEVWPHMWHVWMLTPGFPEARKALQEIATFTRNHISGDSQPT